MHKDQNQQNDFMNKQAYGPKKGLSSEFAALWYQAGHRWLGRVSAASVIPEPVMPVLP
jgi:hypothetical protein